MPRRGQQLDECARAASTLQHVRQFCQCAAERQHSSVSMRLSLVSAELFLMFFSYGVRNKQNHTLTINI